MLRNKFIKLNVNWLVFQFSDHDNQVYILLKISIHVKIRWVYFFSSYVYCDKDLPLSKIRHKGR